MDKNINDWHDYNGNNNVGFLLINMLVLVDHLIIIDYFRWILMVVYMTLFGSEKKNVIVFISK